MNRSVDLVIVGLTPAARAAAIAAAQVGRRVLVVDPTTRRPRCRRFRRVLGCGLAGTRLVSVLTGVEVVCVDGAPGVEAVVLRRLGSGRLLAVNARELLVTTQVAAGVVAPGSCACRAAAAIAAAPE